MTHHPIKTLLSLAAVGTLAAVALTGCASSDSDGSNGSGGAASADQKLSYWLWQDDATDTTWTDLADEFNAQSTNGTVEMQVIPLAQYEDKLLNALASGGGPDAARFKDVWLGEFVKAKAVAPLSERVDAWDGSSDIVPALLDAGKVPGDDEVYLLPHQYTTLYMYYNKAIFAANGLEAPQTHDDVLAAAQTLADAGQFAMDIRGGAGGQDQWAAWMYSGGAEFVNGKGDVTLAKGAAVDVNQDYLDMGEFAPPGSLTADFAAVRGNFTNGTTAMMIHHPGSLAAVREALGDDVGVIAMPTAKAGQQATLGSMSGNVIFAGSKKQDLAWEWISWLNTEGPHRTMSLSPQGQLPVLTSVAQDEKFTSDPALEIAIEAQSYAQTWPLLPGTSTVVNKDWVPTIQSAFEGKITSQESLEQLAAVLTGK